MFDLQLWVFAVTLPALLLSANAGGHNPRRSAGTTQGSLTASKSGWRPVVGSGGLLYGSFGTAPLHAQGYKIPIPVLDVYQSSSRPLVTKDATKITSIAQSYRPTTLRTVSTASTVPVINQPISSYHNPFNVQTNSFANYKFMQNYPTQSVFVRNTHNQYIERPVFSKIPNKVKQNNYLQNAMLQQLTNIQPIQFGQYQTGNPVDLYGKPQDNFVRQKDIKKPPSTTIETFKPEVFKLDNDAAPQSVNQQVKTIQQQGLPNIGNTYSQYSFGDAIFPPSILGSFGSFGIQSLKGRDTVYHYPTTFGPSQSTKTIFNSFSYSPNYKTTPTVFATTTPKAPTTVNQKYFGNTYSDIKIAPTPQTKVYVHPKIDPNANLKTGFMPSPQDPFSNKNLQSDFNKLLVTTYNPSAVHTTTLASNYYDYNFGQNYNQHAPSYQNQQSFNYHYEKKKQNVNDSVPAGNQHVAPTKTQSGNTQSTYRPTYEVVETTESEYVTQSSPAPWLLTSDSYDFINHKVTEQAVKKDEFDDILGRTGTTPVPDLPEEYAIVTEAENGHDNSLNYDSQVESQSRRPLGDDFEPIVKHKLKDYYYKVSTPNYDNYSTSRRTKKPTEPPKYTTTAETTTLFNNNKENNIEQAEALPTLPPHKHFRRPGTGDSNDKDKIRKRNKIRRRRPPLANINRTTEHPSTTRLTTTALSTTEAIPTTEAEEVYTIRPRVRPTKGQQLLTTPTVTTDFITSALPTISPTAPTVVKKKLAHRRPLTTTTTARSETTTQYFAEEVSNKDSPIMRISNRPHLPKLTYDYKNDYSHKQDEKDTPTSDVAVSLSDTLQSTVESEQDFSFHKDFKPIEAKLEPVAHKVTTTAFYKEDNIEDTTTPRSEITTTVRPQRPRLRNKFNRTRFNVKDYKNRMSSTTTTTEKTTENTPKIRFPQRKLPYSDIENETTTERKKFTPKEPRHKIGSNTENKEQVEKEIHSFKPNRQRLTTTENIEATTVKVSSRIRNGQRRPRPPPEETTEVTSSSTVHSKRPMRKKIKDSEVGESIQDIVTETTIYERNDITSERTRSESAIMKIADKKHHDHLEHLFEHSKRVSDLTLAASKDYNKPGMFKTVSTNSRRIPNYFTIATEDPILPIEAFFPQLNQRKDT